MSTIATWFDIWGSMQGNTNEAMALGLFFFGGKLCFSMIFVFLFQVWNVLKYYWFFYQKLMLNLLIVS